MRIFYFFSLLVISTLSFAAETNAQSKVKQKAGFRLPLVGTIRDYPATGLMVGCGNSYYYFERRPELRGENYVFLSNADGTNVWMNLDGRDVSLKLVKAPKSDKFPLQIIYRWKNVSIIVYVEDFKSPDAPYEEGDAMHRMKIIVRRGRARKTIRAVGSADC